MVKVSVIVVNYNCGGRLIETIHSILSQSRIPDEIIVVDNGSTDGSIENLAKSFGATIKILKNSYNLGFAKAVNRVLPKVDGDFVLLVNCDVVLSYNYVEKLLDLMARLEDCFAVSGAILFKGLDIVWSCGSRVDPTTGFNWHLYWKSRVDMLPKAIIKVDYIPFAASLLRRDVLAQLGLDEHFFIYCEDLDMCLMARRRGWNVYVDMSAYAYHDVEYGRRSLTLFRYYHQLRGNLHVFIKHRDAFNLVLTSVFWLILLNVVELVVLRVSSAYFIERFKAILYTLRNLRDTLHESKTVLKVGRLRLDSRVKEALWMMIRHVRTRGHSW